MPETVWITGASYGLGLAVARAHGARGARVALSARGADKLEAAKETVEKAGGRAAIFPLDVTDGPATHEAVRRIETELGPIDRAILNAGTHQPIDGEGFEASGLERLLSINLVGLGHGIEALRGPMAERGEGQIALVASVAGYRGLPTAAYYAPSKAGAIALAESLKFDFDRLGIDLRVINPGFVRTPLTDKNDFSMPFLLEPEDAAARILRGLDGSGFEIAFPTRFVLLLKLMRILPYGLYFPLARRITRK